MSSEATVYPEADHSSESDPDTADDWECESYDSPGDSDVDIANTHESNKELAERDAVKEFLKKIKSIDTLEDLATRQWIGSLPLRWSNGAIPLFTHNGTDYQLHISYTWMKGIRTAGEWIAPSWEVMKKIYAQNKTNKEDQKDREHDADVKVNPDRAVDSQVHCLARASEQSSMEFVTNPSVVIPFGKLFLNRLGHSSWTGYEVFVSGSLELWLIYVPGEQDYENLNIVDSGLFPSPREISPNGPKDNPTEQEPREKLVRFWTSLTSLQTATFEGIHEQIGQTRVLTGHFYLLEISKHQASLAIPDVEAIRSSLRRTGLPSRNNFSAYLEGDSFCVDAVSPVGGQLLLLAKENAKRHFVRVVFELPTTKRLDRSSSLISLVAETGSHEIIRRLNNSAYIDVYIDAYASESDFCHPNLIDILKEAEQNNFHALFESLLRRIEFNSILRSGTTLFLQAILTGNYSLVKSIVDSGRVDLNIVDLEGVTPLSQAIRSEFPQIANYLLDTGQIHINTINSSDILGRTPLHIAVERGQRGVIKRILEIPDVDIHRYDLSGSTPQSLAEGLGYHEIVGMLKEAINVQQGGNCKVAPRTRIRRTF
ncbi:hypothetical protein F5X97DRAFT_289399 [Nemania serpens]|nr:hypothetical protein F5X97DRAFT_289399 [Nemania serpens]